MEFDPGPLFTQCMKHYYLYTFPSFPVSGGGLSRLINFFKSSSIVDFDDLWGDLKSRTEALSLVCVISQTSLWWRLLKKISNQLQYLVKLFTMKCDAYD